MSEEQSEDQWVSSAEGAEILGTAQTNLLYYAKIGEIAYRGGTGSRIYKLTDILKVRRKLAQRKRAKRAAPAVLIDWLSTSDLPAGLRLIQSLYSDEIDLAEIAVYQSWRKHNNRITMAAFSLDRQECFASIQVLPLNEQVILDILHGKRSENSILPDEIESYERPGAYTLLVTNVTVLPDKPELLYQILAHYIDFWVEHYPERFITRVYAQAVSARGDLLIQHFFMTPRYDLAQNAYMLDLARPGAAKMVKLFQERLAKKAPLPPELQANYTLPVVPTISDPAISQADERTPAPPVVESRIPRSTRKKKE